MSDTVQIGINEREIGVRRRGNESGQPSYSLNRRLRERIVVAQLCICPKCPKSITVIMRDGCTVRGCRMVEKP